jgi:hypothetical protein
MVPVSVGNTKNVVELLIVVQEYLFYPKKAVDVSLIILLEKDLISSHCEISTWSPQFTILHFLGM